MSNRFKNIQLFWGQLCALLLLSVGVQADVNGTVFRDLPVDGIVLNSYGVYDANERGIANVTVTAVCGDATASAITDTKGNWSIAKSCRDIKIEFSGWPTYLSESPNRAGNIAVQFVTNGATADLALHDPADYTDTATPDYVTSRQQNGSGVGNEDPSIETIHYTDTGLNRTFRDINRTRGTGPVPIVSARVKEIGSTWGKAFQKSKQRLFASAVLQRHIGFASGDPASLYILDYSAGVNAVTTRRISLQGIVPSNGGKSIDLGSIKRRDINGTDHTLPDDPSLPNVDLDAYAKVAKMSFGDIDFDQQRETLWLVNLYQKALIALDAKGDLSKRSSTTRQYPIARIPNFPSCNNGEMRPWALKIHQGRGYLGAVCDESGNSGHRATKNSRAYVLSFDLSKPAAGFREELNFPLNYTKDQEFWHTWSDDYRDVNITDSGAIKYAQAILGDIEFDANNTMYLAFIDRLSLQYGYHNYHPIPGDSNATEDYVLSSDILRACRESSGSYSLEGSDSCDKANFDNDFLNDAGGDGALDYSAGALALLAGKNQLLHSTLDPSPLPHGVGKPKYWFSTGVNTLSTTNGSIENWYSVLYTNDERDGYNGKSNSMGDIELLTAPTPTEIGDRVWLDSNADGIQDAGEVGIADVNISLCTADGKRDMATVTTDAKGYYLFSNDPTPSDDLHAKYNIRDLRISSGYIIRIANVQGGSKQVALGANLLTVAHSAKSNSNHRAVLVGDDAEIRVTAESMPFMGANNNNFDFGFNTNTGSLCGSVTQDSDNDDIGDEGMMGIALNLYRDSNGDGRADGSSLDRAVTDKHGGYCFHNISGGDYVVKETQPINYVNVSEDEGGSDDDKRDNGAINSIAATVAVGEVDAGNDFVEEGIAKAYRIGDLFWVDTNKNGRLDTKEMPINGATVALLDGNGHKVASTTTSSRGEYHFDVPLGVYKVKFTIPNHYAKDGYLFTKQSANSKDQHNRVDATGITLPVTMGLGHRVDLTLDAAIYRKETNIFSSSASSVGAMGLIAMMLSLLAAGALFVWREETQQRLGER